MLYFVLMALFPLTLSIFIAFLAFTNDLTDLPVYILFPLSPVYVVGIFVFWIKAEKSYQERKFKKLIALFFLVFLAFASPISVILAAVPNWSFTVATDKTIYRLGENVTITTTLTNNAYFAKSLHSHYGPFLEIRVTNGSMPYPNLFMDQLVSISDSVGPRQALQKTLTWQAVNGTGEYYIHAAVIGTNRYQLSEQITITITP